AATMLDDLQAVALAPDPFAVKPVDLPSMRGAGAPVVDIPDEAPIRPPAQAAPVGAGSDSPGLGAGVAGVAAAGSPDPRAARQRPRIRVNRWWSGGYVVDDAASEVRDRVQAAVDRAMGHAQRAVSTAMAAVGLGGAFGGGGIPGAGAAPAPGWQRAS